MQTHSRTTLRSTILRLMMIPVLLIGIFGFASSPAYAEGTVIYVDLSASGASNGTSWADAYTVLQSALSAATSGDQIWVAAATYVPGASASNTFALKNGVAVYGGFAGTETLLAERNPKVNVTILSGAIGSPSSIDNISHVVTGSSTDNTAILDGFTITAGFAESDLAHPYGGGMNNVNGHPTLSNLIFSGNEAGYGGGMFNSGSSPTLTNVTFISNTADRAGGMYNTLNSNPSLINVTFKNNSALVRGGGMTTSGSSPTLVNVTFSGNTAPIGAGLHNVFDSFPVLTNVTFSGNSASNTGGGIFNDDSNPVIRNTILYNNTGGSISNVNSAPVVTYSIVQGGYLGVGNLNLDPLLGPIQDNGGYTQTMALGSTSPAIDSGDDANCPATDQRGIIRPQGAHCDIGAYELVDNDPPDTTIGDTPPNPDSDNTPTFTFSGSDVGGSGVASFRCQMDGGGFSPCASPFTSPVLLPGSHTFEVRAIDYVSNPDPTPASYTWTLDYTPTLVSSIVRADANPTSVASVDFTVTFSANVTGVDSGDFELSTSGVSGASITGVSGSNNIYTVSVNTGSNNGMIRLDIPALADIADPIGNSLTNLPYTSGELYNIIKTGTFTDVPNDHWAWRYIETLYFAGITSGCNASPPQYCPGTVVTRDQMAVFLLKAKHGSGYVPPNANGDFQDVPTDYWAAAWIEQLAAEGITSGCSVSPAQFCPTTPVTRDQMAVFLLKAKHGDGYTPPVPTGVFEDAQPGFWAAAWIEQLAAEGITSGCSVTPSLYCPTDPVTRDQMAVFLDKTFGIPPLP